MLKLTNETAIEKLQQQISSEKYDALNFLLIKEESLGFDVYIKMAISLQEERKRPASGSWMKAKAKAKAKTKARAMRDFLATLLSTENFA